MEEYRVVGLSFQCHEFSCVAAGRAEEYRVVGFRVPLQAAIMREYGPKRVYSRDALPSLSCATPSSLLKRDRRRSWRRAQSDTKRTLAMEQSRQGGRERIDEHRFSCVAAGRAEEHRLVGFLVSLQATTVRSCRPNVHIHEARHRACGALRLRADSNATGKKSWRRCITTMRQTLRRLCKEIQNLLRQVYD